MRCGECLPVHKLDIQKRGYANHLVFDRCKSTPIVLLRGVYQGFPLSGVTFQYYNADLLDVPDHKKNKTEKVQLPLWTTVRVCALHHLTRVQSWNLFGHWLQLVDCTYLPLEAQIFFPARKSSIKSSEVVEVYHENLRCENAGKFPTIFQVQEMRGL